MVQTRRGKLLAETDTKEANSASKNNKRDNVGKKPTPKKVKTTNNTNNKRVISNRFNDSDDDDSDDENNIMQCDDYIQSDDDSYNTDSDDIDSDDIDSDDTDSDDTGNDDNIDENAEYTPRETKKQLYTKKKNKEETMDGLTLKDIKKEIMLRELRKKLDEYMQEDAREESGEDSDSDSEDVEDSEDGGYDMNLRKKRIDSSIDTNNINTNPIIIIEGTIDEINNKEQLNKSKIGGSQIVAKYNELVQKFRKNGPTVRDILTIPMSTKDREQAFKEFIAYHNNMHPSDYFTGRKELSDKLLAFKDAMFTKRDIDKMEKLEGSLKTTRSQLPLKYQILSLDTTDENKRIILQKLETLESLSTSSDDYPKCKEWIHCALSMPYNKYISINVKQGEYNKFIIDAKKKLDSKLYGMDLVKEQILEILNSKIQNPKAKNKLALVGPPGVGKCLAPDTKILMYAGGIKRADEIEMGDILMGDDSSPRLVSSICTGMEEMYKVSLEYFKQTTANSKYQTSFTANAPHIMTVCYNGTIFDIPIISYMLLSDETKAQIYGVKSGFIEYNSQMYLRNGYVNGVNYAKCLLSHEAIEKYIYANSKTRFEFLAGLVDTIGFYHNAHLLLKISNILHVNLLLFLCRSLGYIAYTDEFGIILEGKYKNIPSVRFSSTEWFKNAIEPVTIKSNGINYILCKLHVESIGVDEYYGFTIDRNRRFVLDDLTVTHNTAIVKALSECTGVPFAQISMGGADDKSFLSGHLYTYVGSEPGILVKKLQQLGCNNGIMFFDEFDKIPQTHQGSAVTYRLLHINDPEQNEEFHDDYLANISIDISNIWYMYSLNDEKLLNDAMKDRMHIVRVNGYTRDEKKHIIHMHLLPQALSGEMFASSDISFSDETINYLLNRDAEETPSQYNELGNKLTGVRNLQKWINILVKKIKLLANTTIKDGTQGELNLSYSVKNFNLPFVLNIDVAKKMLAVTDQGRFQSNYHS